MDRSIPSVTPIDPAASVGLPSRERAAAWIALMRQASGAPPKPADGAEAPPAVSAPVPGFAPSPAPEPVRPGEFGGDGRFEKFILALQALRFDLGGVASRTDRVERMRAAAEELFSIDGVPHPVPPMTGPAVESLPVVAPEARPESAAPEGAIVPADSAVARAGRAAGTPSATITSDAPAEPAAPTTPAAASPRAGKSALMALPGPTS